MGAFASRPARRRRTSRRLGWLWRRNPLRRRSDLAEAWLGLLTVVLLCLLPLLGWWTGRSVDQALQRVVLLQHTQRTLVTATVAPAGGAHGAAPAAVFEQPAITGGAQTRHGDMLVWTGPDHRRHTAVVPADQEVWHNDTVQLWTDRKGTIVPAPLDSATAATHSVLAGFAIAAAAGGLVLVCRQILLWRLMLRRLDSWEREWARVGQDWGRTGAGG